MLSKVQMTKILILLDDLGKKENSYEYGLPVWDEKWMALAREEIYELLNGDKEVKNEQDEAQQEVIRLAQVGFMKEFFDANPEVKMNGEGAAKLGVAVSGVVKLFLDAGLLEETE